MNLLENTLRYTDAGGRLVVGAQLEDGGEPRLVLSFDDTAPGPAPDELPRLFERLYRGETSRSRESGGSGLGLSICRAIVESHGGFIEAQPSALGGLAEIAQNMAGIHRCQLVSIAQQDQARFRRHGLK